MLVIAVVLIVVVGPKDLPRMLRTFGRTTAKLRTMAGDFQRQFNEALQEAELDDVKKSVDTLRGLNPGAEIRKQLNPFEQAAADVRAGLDTMMKPATTGPAEPEAHPAEPLKNGPAGMPGEAAAAAVAAPTAKAATAKPSATEVAPASKAAAAKVAPKRSAKTPSKKRTEKSA